MTRAGLALLLVAFGALAEVPAVPEPSAAPFLWEVQGPKAKHYLLGSVHVLPEEAELPPALDDAYAATRALIVETDLDSLATPELQNRMLGAARETGAGGIKARIGKPLYDKLQKRAKVLGMPTPVCNEFRAWFCALALELYPLQQAHFSIDNGIDQRYYSRAHDDGHPVVGLETPDFQIDLFARLPDSLSKQMLAATLDESTYESQSPMELFRIWRTGDVATLDKVVKEMRQKYPELYARLLADRTRSWVAPLADRFRDEEPSLVIVGAAHLVGPDGLVTLLKAQGFLVKPYERPAAPVAAPEAPRPPRPADSKDLI